MQQRLDFQVQEEKEHATEALKQEKEEVLEKLRVAQKEKNEIRAKFKQNNAKIQEEKDQLLAEQTAVKEVVTKALHSMSGLAQEEPESIEMQVGKLVEAIQQLQAWIMELELQAVSSTPQEVRDQREEATRNIVERIRALASECKQLSNCSVQTYECLAEDPELRKLEAQLQEAQNKASTMQAQMKLLTAVERMKISQEQLTV
jgi:trimethylamine:corrinoid methyltransferase-like protein